MKIKDALSTEIEPISTMEESEGRKSPSLKNKQTKTKTQKKQ